MLPELQLPKDDNFEAPDLQEMDAEIEVPSDQWKRGGLCMACRRQNYCRTQCRANKKYAAPGIKEYLRRRAQDLKAEAARHGQM